MKMRDTVAIGLMVLAVACGGQSGTPPPSLTQPTAVTAQPTTATAAPLDTLTFTVRGTVGDSAGRPIGDARLIVMSGPDAGATTLTDASGWFTFTRIRGLATVRAEKDGYKGDAKPLYTYTALEPGMATVWFKLESAVRPPVDLTGTYSITFVADPACGSLPDSVRTRTYATTLRTTYWWQLISLTGATFEKTSNGYPGQYDWNVISLSVFEDFASLYFEDPPLHEVMSSGDTLEISGHASGTISPASAELTVSGQFEFMGAACRSTNHRLILIRTGP